MPVVLLQVALLILQILFFALATIIVGGFVITAISMRFGVPFVRTKRRVYPAIFEALRIEDGDVVYELGSGDGRFALSIAKRYPRAHVVAIEANPLLHLVARIRARIAGNPKNISLRRENFFEADFIGCTKMYTYLLLPVMDALLPIFEEKLHGVRLVSRAFRLRKKPEIEQMQITKRRGAHGEHMLYVYEFP